VLTAPVIIVVLLFYYVLLIFGFVPVGCCLPPVRLKPVFGRIAVLGRINENGGICIVPILYFGPIVSLCRLMSKLDG